MLDPFAALLPVCRPLTGLLAPDSTSGLALFAAHPVAPSRLSGLDLGLVALYLLGITLFGLRFRKSSAAHGAAADRSLRSYFLADNTIPWWAIALSIVSAETSTLTIISIPGVAFAGNFGFLQVVLGYMLGRIVVAVLLLPRYFAGEMLTAYQLIDLRFGRFLHKVTAGLFLLTRAAAEGVRVFAVSIVVGIAIGTRDVLSIGIILALTLLYTFEGGMAAVIWTDVVQMAIYLGGTLVAIATLGSHIHGGWGQIHAVAAQAGKFHMLNFAFNLTTTYTFWAGVLGGAFLTMASHGTDQLMVQRMLAARNLRESQLALLSSGIVIFVQFALFLLIGAGLFVFYGQHPALLAGGLHGLSPDRIFPTFIVREMPAGIAGLLVAAILAAAMSNLSAALNSLSSTTVIDFYVQLRPNADAAERALISKGSTVAWALVLFAIAVVSLRAGGKGHVVEIGLSIASVAYGCLLGVFLLGALTRFATEAGAALGMVCGFALNLWLWQGAFPVHLGPLTIPHIAWTWYVLIGSAATFAIGCCASLLFRKQSRHAAGIGAAAALALACCPGAARGASQQPINPDFTPVFTLVNQAIADHKLPGAVVLVGHDGHVVFEQAFGDRELASEPGLDGQPHGQLLAQPVPMTLDTVFDMASLTKDLATAPSIMQLYEQGKLDFDDPVQKYLPGFNPSHDSRRAQVTIRMLLTHTSGEAPDVDLKDEWGLAAPDPAEGFRRALTTPLQSAPGEVFRYSDINFILLGDLVQTLSGQPLDVYAEQHIFAPLGMTQTRFLPFAKVCGPHKVFGSAVAWAPAPRGRIAYACAPGTWSTGLLPGIAPTAHDDQSKDHPDLNPDFDHLLRGVVDDPSTRRMGGVAGHAGVFSTAHDVSLYAQALLDKLTRNTGPFPLQQSTLELMTTPEQPGHTRQQIAAANTAAEAAEPAAMAADTGPAAKPIPGLAPHYPAIQGQDLRGFGWDIDTAYSKPRGRIFPIGSFGHTGFTGTSLWMDPGSDTYVILLANAIYPRGNAPISNLRGQVATAAAEALHVKYHTAAHIPSPASLDPSPASLDSRPQGQGRPPYRAGVLPAGLQTSTLPTASRIRADWEAAAPGPQQDPSSTGSAPQRTLTGIDVLEATHFAALREAAQRHGGRLRFGLLSNQTGLDSHGRRTIDILSHDLSRDVPNARLTTLFSPEHGLYGLHDDLHVANETDTTTGLPVISLYGPTPADKRPKPADLAALDAVVIDLQDAGVRFYTYETLVGYFLEAAADAHIEIIVLDRPNPLGGLAVQGPVSDPGYESYTDFMPLPLRHGMTLGELAQFFNARAVAGGYFRPGRSGTTPQAGLHAQLTVVPMQHWQRREFFDETGVPWTDPSPNLRSLEAATLYPGLGLLDYANISVGRGSATPFEFFGAGVAARQSGSQTSGSGSKTWFHAADVVAALNARHISGVTFAATTAAIAEDKNRYPYHGQSIEAVRITVTDRHQLDSPELGMEILAALHRLYPAQFQLDKTASLIANHATFEALQRSGPDAKPDPEDPRRIAHAWDSWLAAYNKARQPFLLYP